MENSLDLDQFPVAAPRIHPLEIFSTKKRVNISAPMVRYSKLPFRELIRRYNVDIAYTPMILSNVFKHSAYSRNFEFQTSLGDDPVIVQFAASTAVDFADAAELVAPYCSGVDLNCGCPQKWAIHEHIGSYLMEDPEMIRDMVRQAKARTSQRQFGGQGGSFPISVKIRVHPDLRKTVDLVRMVEAAGADWITVHGRTRQMKNTQPVNLDAIKLMKESVSVPLVANGDVFSLDDANGIFDHCKTDGVMAARGLLENPALFSGAATTPWECVEEYVRLGIAYGSTTHIFHHHIMFMLDKLMSRAEKRYFNTISTIPGIVDYLQDHYGMDIGGIHS
ncbi:uncharacterized protein BJ171DRAFT_509647 [Polychytrium aggregatum]|uniref:uncharacterized protein n=1 Tax=Polychytrium aggregatum TaxID=110093 RepID=UPI0022FDD657|nr:uncharacterized protein BJ171DRAFT_509647 [Polychytrium aggregatum]KAI9203427.1 hypothetical protein BJ171DRAFT_509647 [Polychytrium aggregatum]